MGCRRCQQTPLARSFPDEDGERAGRYGMSADNQALVTLKLANTTFCPAEAVSPTAPLPKVVSSACPTSMPFTKKCICVPLKYTLSVLWAPLFRLTVEVVVQAIIGVSWFSTSLYAVQWPSEEMRKPYSLWLVSLLNTMP